MIRLRRSLAALLSALLVSFPASAAQKSAPGVSVSVVSVIPAAVPVLPNLGVNVSLAPLVPAISAVPLTVQLPIQADKSAETQSAQAARTFDGLFVSATAAAEKPVVSVPRAGPSRFALIPAAARMLQRHHVDRPRAERLIGRALRGMMEKAGVKTAKEARPYFKELRQALNAPAIGYGFTWNKPFLGGPMITSVAPGSPAEKAGLKPGDEIDSVDGRALEHLSAHGVGALLNGEQPMELKISRPNANGGYDAFGARVETAFYPETAFHRLIPGIVDVFEAAAASFAPTSAPEMLEAALARMGGALDRFTAYFNKDEAAEFSERFTKQNYGGFGFTMRSDDGSLSIKQVKPGSVASRAGLALGDALLAVDGRSLTGLDPEQARNLLRREAGLPVVLSVRSADGTTREVVMKAETVQVALAGSRMLAEGVGYVRLSIFSEASVDEAYDQILALRAQGARELVVDLRFNPGGQLTAATALAAVFLPNNAPIASMVSTRDGKTDAAAGEPGEFADMRLSVILNGESASASEMFAAALRDNGRAVLVGQPSWGKGVGQQTHELTEGRGLKITSFRWYTPMGRTLKEGDGLKPDVAVENSPLELDAQRVALGDGLYLGALPGLEDALISAAWNAMRRSRP